MKLNRNFNRASRKQAGFSLIELLIVVAIMLVIAAIAVPSLMAAKRSANQSSAVGSLRNIASAENTFRGNQSPQSYGTLTKLGTADPNNNSEPYLDSSWETAAVSTTGIGGYTFVDLGTPDNSSFGVAANPVTAGDGGFAYCILQTGAIHRVAGAGATAAITTAAGCQAADVLGK